MARTSFLISTVFRIATGQPKTCPHCESADTVLLQRKKFLLELRRCEDCRLTYRYPKEDVARNRTFYQDRYREGMTTVTPSLEELEILKGSNFTGTDKDFSLKIQLVQQEKSGGRLLDYGCSWGYGLIQFQSSGYDVVGFEISRPRAEYGRKHLKLEIIDDFRMIDSLQGASFDIIHSSHVLEHLPELNSVFSRFRRLLKPDGVLIIFVPNAGGRLARELGVRWGPMIGEKHPLAFTAEFFARNLPKHGFLSPRFKSSPYGSSKGAPATVVQEGDELMVIAGLAEEPMRG